MMHGWILYGGDEVVELTRACEEARGAGVHLEVVAPADVDIVLNADDPARIFRRGVTVPVPAFAIAGFVNEADACNLALLQQLEAQGVLCVNRAETLKKTSDKLLTLQLLAAQGIPVPKTILIRPGITPASFISAQLGMPAVVKIINGSKGHGVALVHTGTELEALLEIMDAAHGATALLAQEFVADSRGRDVRVLVIDGQPRVCMLRRNRSADGFKSNISAGGSAEAYPMSEAIRELSCRVIRALDLNIGGIDLLFKGDGFLVGEANSIPGFQGIESCLEINVPAEILKSIGRQLKARAADRCKTSAENFRSLEELKGIQEPELVSWFILGACSAVEKVQKAILMDMVRRNASTEFGKTHGFDSIRSVADFRQRVPLGEWSDFEPWALRMEHGEKDLLFAGRPACFIRTSGTTGNNKRIPESADGQLAKSLVSRVRTALLMRMLPKGEEGFFIPLSNVTKTDATACGIPVGYASGLTLTGVPAEIRRRMAVPLEALRAEDPDTLNYLIMRFALLQPLVCLLIGNNPGRMTALMEMADQRREALIADIAQGTLACDLPLEPELRRLLEKELKPDPERARALRNMAEARGRLEPRDYWPGLKYISCWLGGTIGRYLEGLKSWLPEGVTFMDCGYGASEGKFNIPVKPGVVEGPLALFGYFFEFIPLAGGEPLMAHELLDGAEYRLIISSYSGLYRYDMHDIIRVAGFTGRNPNIQFVSKTADIANVAGEKLTGAILSNVIRQTLAARQLGWRHFCVVEDVERHRYDFCVEPEGAHAPDAACLTELDKALIEQADLYQLYRSQKLIQNPRLLVMKHGWLDSLYVAAGARPDAPSSVIQVKLPMVCRQPPAPDSIAQTIEL